MQRDTLTRVNACIRQAQKAHPNQGSPAYQSAVQACTTKARQVGSCVTKADGTAHPPGSAEYTQVVDDCLSAIWK